MIGTGLPKTPGAAPMNGIHDMGGMEGFGPVKPEPNEPPFHADWEGRALAMNRALGYAGDLEHRQVARQDRGDAAARISHQDLLPEMGAAAGAAADRMRLCRRRRGEGRPRAAAGQAAAAQSAGGRGRQGAARAAAHSREPTSAPARFKVGDRVRTKNIHPRDPYAAAALCARQGRRGRMRARLPRVPGLGRDRQGENPQWLYTVLFDGRELWGETPIRR